MANGVEGTPQIEPAAMFKMHIEGLPANIANTVQVSSSLLPGEGYFDQASPSSPDFESACWSVIYEADADETLTAEAKALIKQSLGINAICATELTTTIQTCGGDSQTAHFGSPRLIRVDTNRDGVISFDGTKDLTSPQSPYCFWLNDNWDRYNSEYDDHEELKPRRFGNDASDDQIDNARDLQDFFRIRIKPPASEKLPRLVEQTPSSRRTFLSSLAWSSPRMLVTMGLKKKTSCRATYWSKWRMRLWALSRAVA